MNNFSTIHDLERLIALKTKESFKLAYRKPIDIINLNDKKLENIAILVCSMANAKGGTIFFGIESSRKIAKAISPINKGELDVNIIKQALDNIINPLIDGLEIFEIPINSENIVLFIKVPNSNNAPHIASDRRYYKRVDIKEHLMEEYEIREMYQRSKKSEIELFGIVNTAGIPTLKQGKFELVNFYPRFMIKNISSVIEKYYKVEIYIPSALHNPNFDILQKHFSRMENEYSVFAISNDSPLFQNELATIVEANIFVNQHNYKYFDEKDIMVKIYYTNGVKSQSYKIKEMFLYRHNTIEATDFANLEFIEQ